MQTHYDRVHEMAMSIYVKCDRTITSVGLKQFKGLLKSGAFLLHGVFYVSVNPVCLGQ